MYRDAVDYANSCPQCAIVQETERWQNPPLHPIITYTEHPFQIVEVHILAVTSRVSFIWLHSSTYLQNSRSLLSPRLKAVRIVQLLADEHLRGMYIPEALLSDGGTKFWLFLMNNICNIRGFFKSPSNPDVTARPGVIISSGSGWTYITCNFMKSKFLTSWKPFCTHFHQTFFESRVLQD